MSLRTSQIASARQEVGSTNTWLVSFTDVIALMLTFFVLIFSMSEPVQNTVTEEISTLKENASVTRGAPDFSGQVEKSNLIRDNRVSGLDLTYLETLLKEMLGNLIQDEPKLSGIKLRRSNDMLFIMIPDRVLKRGNALDSLAVMLARLRNDIAVWVPIQTAKKDYSRALRRGAVIKDRLTNAGYEDSILLKTFAPFYSKGLSAQLHIAIMDTKVVSR